MKERIRLPGVKIGLVVDVVVGVDVFVVVEDDGDAVDDVLAVVNDAVE